MKLAGLFISPAPLNMPLSARATVAPAAILHVDKAHRLRDKGVGSFDAEARPEPLRALCLSFYPRTGRAR